MNNALKYLKAYFFSAIVNRRWSITGRFSRSLYVGNNTEYLFFDISLAFLFCLVCIYLLLFFTLSIVFRAKNFDLNNNYRNLLNYGFIEIRYKFDLERECTTCSLVHIRLGLEKTNKDLKFKVIIAIISIFEESF